MNISDPFINGHAMNSTDIYSNWTVPLLHHLQNWTDFNDVHSTRTVVQTLVTASTDHNALLDRAKVQIFLYGVIFMLTIVGNTLVIVTLAQIRRMRTVTNIFLLNLAVADLLIGVFCMPFTLVGAILRNFIFGATMCRMIPFLQACSVAVGSWTLVAISVERYYAICHPLRSLSWQTLCHAYKTVAVIWILSLFSAAPIAILSELLPTNEGKQKCRESWPNTDYERTYNIFLIIFMMVIPLLILMAAYYCIIKALCKSMKNEQSSRQVEENSSAQMYVHIHSRNHKLKWSTRNRSSVILGANTSWRTLRTSSAESGLASTITRYQKPQTALRRTNAIRSYHNKRRVIWMLIVVVLEFFICWSPLYAINTIVLFDPKFVYEKIGYKTISLLQLLAYCSSCCNPITYCFMNYSFRKSLFKLFSCCRNRHKTDEIMLMEVKLSNNRCSENNTA